MKQAFDKYFEKLNKVYLETFGTKPLVPYSEDLNKDLIVSEPDEEGYVEWQPRLQKEEVDWNRIENEIGFKINAELKNYYSIYSFSMIDGIWNNISLYFDAINLKKSVEETIKYNFDVGQTMYPNSEIFAIGIAEIDGDDGYTLYYDNKTGIVFCYENDTKNKMNVSDSISELIENMEADI